MAVALRAYTQGTSQGSGTVTIAWPTGTIAGDLAILVAQDYYTNGPTNYGGSGWTAIGRGVWYKRVTTGDLAQPLSVRGRTTFLQTFSGADKIGTWRNSHGLTVTKDGGALFVDGWGPSRVSTIDPGSTDRLGNQIRLVTDNTPNAVWFRAFTTKGYKALQDHDDDCSYVAYEILPIAGPNAPTVVEPSAWGQDIGSPIVFSWIHNSNSGATQEAAQIRVREVNTPTWYYVKSDGTITTTVTNLTQSSMTASINTGQLTVSKLYEFEIATQDFGVLGAYSPSKLFNTWAKPTVDSITPTSPAESLTPTIAWTRTANVGSPEAWQVRISAATDTTPDTPIWDSQITSGNASQTVAPATAPWVNGQALYAWVRVMQTGGLWSPWTKDNATFTVSWTAPAAPTAVTPANVADGPTQVTIEGIPSGYGTYLEMSYDGTTWTSVENDYDNPATYTTNLIKNPSFETGTTGVSKSTVITLSQTTFASTLVSGSNALQIAIGASATINTYVYQNADNITGGQWVAFATNVRWSSGSRYFKTMIRWIDSGGSYTTLDQPNIVLPITQGVNNSSGGSRYIISGQAPSDAVKAQCLIYFYDDAAATVPPVDTSAWSSDAWHAAAAATQAEALAAVAAYYDGSTTDTADYDYAWTGTAHNSTSTATTKFVPSTLEVPLAAYGQPAYYRARNSNVISGVTIYSGWTVSAAHSSTDTNSYMVDDDNQYIPISIREEQGPELVQGISVNYGHGASKPRQDQTAPQGLRGQLTLYAPDIVEEYTLREWLTTKGAWTVRWVPEINPGTGRLFRLNTRMALARAASVSHVIQTAHAARTITFEWVEQ